MAAKKSRYSNTATRFQKTVNEIHSVYKGFRRFFLTDAGAIVHTPTRAHTKRPLSMPSRFAMRLYVLARGAAPPGPLPAVPVRRGSHHRNLVHHRPWLPPPPSSAVPLPYLWGSPRPIVRLCPSVLPRSSGGAPQSKSFSNTQPCGAVVAPADVFCLSHRFFITQRLFFGV